jgi:hypothetical protein
LKGSINYHREVWRCLVLLCACGRIGFDPSATDSAAPDASDPSLVAHYQLDDDPNDGVLDSTGHGLGGSCETTCPMPEPGKIGKAYRFNGTTDFIRVLDAQLFHTPTVTSTVWVKLDLLREQCIVQKRLGPTFRNSWQLEIDDALGRVGICTTPFPETDGRCDQGGQVAANEWHHLAVVEDGTMHRGYLDGTEVIAAPVAQPDYDDGPVLIGADIDDTTPFCFVAGLIDDVRIYDRVLGVDELAALAQ